LSSPAPLISHHISPSRLGLVQARARSRRDFERNRHAFVGGPGNTSGPVIRFPWKPGSGPGPHGIYDEIQIIREAEGMVPVNGQALRGCVGAHLCHQGREIHSFKAIGDFTLSTRRFHLQLPLHPREPIVTSLGTVLDEAPCSVHERVSARWRNIVYTHNPVSP